MATYLPNVVDVLPDPALYTPDFSFIDTMLRRRQGLYEQGFAQVNNAYSFVNRSVTNPYSVKVRDEFLSQARNNLKNLAAMDLSQQQNVQAAKGVFDPFVKNQPVLMDMAFTAHMDQQESIAETFRLKDGGKEFSEDNLNYLRQQRAAFANDSITSVGSYYANRRSFNPYYDYYKEVQEKMKDFKPNTYKIDRIDGLYKISKDDSSWREAEVSEYLNGVLSDKAKQQMRIEAQVRLGGNPEALAGAYTQAAQQQLEMNKYNLGLIDKQMAATGDPKMKEQLKTQRERIEDSNREIDTTLQTISKGDLSYIKNNSEKLASSIYFNSKLSGFVKAFAHEEVAVKIDADQVGLALMRENRADARQSRAFAHAEKMKRMEIMAATAASVGNFQARTLAEGENGIKLETTIAGLQQEVDQANQALQGVTLQMKQHVLTKMKERDPNIKTRAEDLTQAQIDNWLKTGGPKGGAISKGDPYYTMFQPQLAAVTAQESAAKNRLSKIEQGTLEGLSEADRKVINDVNKSLDAMGQIKLDDGTVISGRELASGIKNGTISTSINWKGDAGTIKINGKTYNVQDQIVGAASTPARKNVELLQAVNQVKGIQSRAGSAYDKYEENRKRYMEKNFAEMRLLTSVVSFDEGSAAAKSLEGSVGTLLPTGYDIKHAGVGATPNNQGHAYFYITPKPGNNDTEDKIAEKLTAAGAKVRMVKTEKGPTLFEVQGLNNNIARQFREYSPMESAVINEMKSYTGAREYTSTPFKVPNNNTNFFIKKSGDLYYLHINTVGESYPSAFSSPIEAVATARMLGANNGHGVKLFERDVTGSTGTPAASPGPGYDYSYE